MPLIECVPNVSEGRDRTVLEALARSLTGVDDVHLLDVHADPWHHRSVYTVVGSPAAVVEAVLALARTAVAQIDLRDHAGEHPRMGVLDVVPFVPLLDVAVEDCVTLAEAVGARLADGLSIPVCLYGRAARTEGAHRLAPIRRAGFEAFAAGSPLSADYGPLRPHPTAGATAVGVRGLLVAFNVRLATDDARVARTIARRVRSADGGPPGVQALGFTVEGRAQVSMNLTDPLRTTTVDAFDAVAVCARDLNVGIEASEIVGLAPRASLPDTAARIQLAGSVDGRSLEAALAGRYPEVSSWDWARTPG